MTNSDQQPAPPTATGSINDSLPTTNPSLRTVLIVLGCLGAAALVLTFHKSLGL